MKEDKTFFLNYKILELKTDFLKQPFHSFSLRAALCQEKQIYVLICPHEYVCEVPIIIQNFNRFDIFL